MALVHENMKGHNGQVVILTPVGSSIVWMVRCIFSEIQRFSSFAQPSWLARLKICEIILMGHKIKRKKQKNIIYM